MKRARCGKILTAMPILAAFLSAGIAGAQQNSAALSEPQQLEARVNRLMSALDGMRQQLDESQHEMEELRGEIRGLKEQLAQKNGGADATQAASDLQASVQQLQEQSEVLQAEVKQHDQTKIESLSKYPVRLSGMLLFTSFMNSGGVDSIDLPITATGGTGQGSLGATARQTILGLEASGPSLWGARTSADINVDFFGGIPYADYTTSAGTVRLRTAHANLNWSHRSLTAAFDRPLISPLQPTSFVSIGEPALAWSGNLWTWAPQLQFKDSELIPNKKLSLELGLMDVPAPGPPQNNGLRLASPSERSRQPGYEARLGYSLPLGDHVIEIGAGGHYSRQSYDYGRHLDAWTGTVDWRIPFTHFLELSGEFYRGRGIGGLGGGAFKDYIIDSENNQLRGVNAEGGWGQLKIRFSHSIESNFAIGEDNAFAGDLHYSSLTPGETDYASLTRNRTFFGNIIFHPKTYLLLSGEYRNIYSWPIAGQVNTNHSLGLAAGYLF